jgi:hypothetical protein
MTAGPVQVLVLGYDEARFDGSVLAVLARLGAAGVVRLVDVVVLRRAADGSLEVVESELEGYGAVATALLAGGADEGASAPVPESWSLADVVPERGVAVVALIEHLWAEPLTAALEASGATLLEETWLAQDDRALLASLER